MKLFVYEFLTGGGCFSWPAAPRPSGSLLAEGTSMIDALVGDLLGEGHDVTVLRDARLPLNAMGASAFHPDSEPSLHLARLQSIPVDSRAAERAKFEEFSGTSDGVILIAPESGGALELRATWVLEAGGRLFSPAPDWIAAAANKHRCCDQLKAAGVPTPTEFDPDGDREIRWPLVSKPFDGCGSHNIRLVHTWEDALSDHRHGRRVEHANLGWPTSVGVLCGPAGNMPLEPCEQHLNRNLSYFGGRTPLSRPQLAHTARELAAQAVSALGPTQGFVGVDLVVSPGEAVVVEINPRLTTSYVGLSRWYHGLAAAMLQVAVGDAPSTSIEGRPALATSCEELEAVRFTATGDATLEWGDDREDVE